MNTSKYCFT